MLAEKRAGLQVTVMKIGYFGSPDISARLLSALLDSSHEVLFAVSNPDRPQGRSGKLVPAEVAQTALDRGLPLYRFENLRKESADQILKKHDADLYVVFAYGKLLPRSVFELPREKTVNLHGSLLPELRGASPIQTAILRGYRQTGWTLQFIEEKMDAGDIIDTARLDIDPDETAGELTERMLPIGIELTLRTLNEFDRLKAAARPQNHDQATFCSKFSMEMSGIDWSGKASAIHDQVRALNPWPIARTHLDDKTIKIYKTARLEEADENQLKDIPPGHVVAVKSGRHGRLLVKTGDGVLELLELQPENKKLMKAHDFLNGYRIASGARFR